MTTAPDQSNPGGHPPALDEAKRNRIIALVAGGSSRRSAARFVGCAPSTVTRTALRDEKFAEELAHAEALSQIELMRMVRNAARQDRYWRAAAWLLERVNPQDFTLPGPGCFTVEQFHEIIVAMVDSFSEGLPAESLRRAMDSLDELTAELRLPEPRGSDLQRDRRTRPAVPPDSPEHVSYWWDRDTASATPDPLAGQSSANSPTEALPNIVASDADPTGGPESTCDEAE